MDIAKIMFPQSNVLVGDLEKGIKTQIVDMELDPFECTFNNDGCVQINTENYSHITLSIGQLQMIKKMINKAEAMYLELLDHEE